MNKAIYFLRKDLRLNNNKIINKIRSAGQTPLLIYVWNEEHLKKEKRGIPFKEFLSEALNLLEKEAALLDYDFKVIHGSLKNDALPIINEVSPSAIYLQKQYLPWEIEEETFLLEESSSQVEIIDNQYLLTEPGDVLTDEGRGYKVFTPFYKKWLRYLGEKNIAINQISDKHSFPKIKEKIEHFYSGPIFDYVNHRDFPYLRGTSELSAWINIGVVSAHSLYEEAIQAGLHKKRDTEPFIRQLAWRDFYYHLYFARPDILQHSFKEAYDDIHWENNPEWLQLWKEGRTGYPFVDAGMRQLLSEGFMHNRLRMVVASFLTKDLLIDWKKGETHFMQYLRDGDLILNNGGWQWAASTGADAQPYFRIFNPVSQSKKFDQKGMYIKKYVPELQAVPDKYIHEPWRMPQTVQKDCGVQIGINYPFPVVEHASQRKKALDMYKMKI